MFFEFEKGRQWCLVVWDAIWGRGENSFGGWLATCIDAAAMYTDTGTGKDRRLFFFSTCIWNLVYSCNAVTMHREPRRLVDRTGFAISYSTASDVSSGRGRLVASCEKDPSHHVVPSMRMVK